MVRILPAPQINRIDRAGSIGRILMETRMMTYYKKSL
jgi:hypothetical protein